MEGGRERGKEKSRSPVHHPNTRHKHRTNQPKGLSVFRYARAVKKKMVDPEDVTASYFCNLIRQTPGQSVRESILSMARTADLTLEDLETLTEKPQPFAESEWEKVAPSFDLNPTLDKYQIRSFAIPQAYLPPSFHKEVMKDSLQLLDVYQERGSSKRGVARIRLMDTVC